MEGEERSLTNSTNIAEVNVEVETKTINEVAATSNPTPAPLPEEARVQQESVPAVITTSTAIGVGITTTEAATAPPGVQQGQGASTGTVPQAASAVLHPPGATGGDVPDPRQLGATSKEFESISLEVKRQPRRVIHFSDGILEEYSTDEEDGEEKEMLKQPPVDPKKMDWMPYIWHYMVVSSFAAYRACDFMGERLAYFFGITSPKYAYALSEYNRLEEDEKETLQQQITEREEHRDRVAREAAAKTSSGS